MASNDINMDEWEELNQLIINNLNSDNQDVVVSEPPSPSPPPEVMYRFVLGKWWTWNDSIRMLARRSTATGLPVWYRRDLEQCTWSPEKVPSKARAVHLVSQDGIVKSWNRVHLVSRDGIVKSWSSANCPLRWYRRDLEQCTLSPKIVSSGFGAMNLVSRDSIVKSGTSEKIYL